MCAQLAHTMEFGLLVQNHLSPTYQLQQYNPHNIPIILCLNQQYLEPRWLLVCPRWHHSKFTHAEEAEEEVDVERNEESKKQEEQTKQYAWRRRTWSM